MMLPGWHHKEIMINNQISERNDFILLPLHCPSISPHLSPSICDSFSFISINIKKLGPSPETPQRTPFSRYAYIFYPHKTIINLCSKTYRLLGALCDKTSGTATTKTTTETVDIIACLEEVCVCLCVCVLTFLSTHCQQIRLSSKSASESALALALSDCQCSMR